jgi:hypothetical protein
MKTEKVIDRKKADWLGMGLWLPEVVHPLLWESFFFDPQSRGCWTKPWMHVAPSCSHYCHGTGKLRKAHLGRAYMVPVGCQDIAHLVPSAPSLPGLPTGSGAAVPLHSLFQPAQALGAFQLEAAGQRLLAHVVFWAYTCAHTGAVVPSRSTWNIS